MTRKPKRPLPGLALIFIASSSLLAAPAIAQDPDVFVLQDGVSTIDQLPELDPEHANHGAFETTGGADSKTITNTELQIPEDVQRGGGGINIPTGAPPSPMTFNGVTILPFTQHMLRFEEFGPERLPAPAAIDTENLIPFPLPDGPKGHPDWAALDTFLDQDIHPYPTRLANTTDLNPWQGPIQTFLGRDLVTPPAEGRPPAEWWAHQRWDEFLPQNYFQAAQADSRTNRGLRDNRQMHGYSVGEFGPGGLYHNTVGAPGFDGTTAGIDIRFHPDMPLQVPNALWTFDGTLPPKLLNVRYGESVLFRHYNALPIDPAANHGFGLHTISTHEHNGHNPAESDGYTNSFFFPGQFYDYRWPIQLAGHDSINTTATDNRAAFPCTEGETLSVVNATTGQPEERTCSNGIIPIRGDYRETMSTHWFHDHMLDYTAQNVYKGNAAMMNYYSAIDRGNEAINDGVNLRLPSGTALNWGNRDYDVNLLIAGKAWDTNGQLFFNVFNTDGFLGDQMLVNWLHKPILDVRSRRYRFRMLNGSVSRYIKVAIVAKNSNVPCPGAQMNGPDVSVPGATATYCPVPFHMIANDGNIMEHSVAFPGGILPTQSIAERYDIIVDFAAYQPGTKLYMVNVMEHDNGRGPEKDAIPLRDVMTGVYHPEIIDNEWANGDPVVGAFLEFNVVGMGTAPPDQSMNPADYVVGGLKMLPLPGFTQAELDGATHRSFHFGRSNGTDNLPWTIETDGGMGLNMDPRRISAAPNLGTNGNTVEIWHISTGGGWSHPIHVHFEEGQILSKDGLRPPEWETLARKDVYRIGPEVDSARELSFAIRFREFAGTYMEHCHNTQHEDTAMLMRWDIENPGQTVLLPTPMPTWDGVGYADSHAVGTFRSGDLEAQADGIVVPQAPANGGDVNGDGIVDRIFDDATLRAIAPPAMELAQVPDMQHILDGYIADPTMAVALGKALFWDQAAGSDGQACASCHFSAGADNRSMNQVSPGLRNESGADRFLFDQMPNGIGGVNYQLTVGDFPFPKTGLNGLLFDDVAGSQGTFDGDLDSPASPELNLAGTDECDLTSTIFGDGSLHYRKTTSRNSPTVIGAVFNHRNFWDGRANNMFNGVDPHGARSNQNNPDQGIWIYNAASGTTSKQQVLIHNASLASQAVGPALSTDETTCAGRTFPLLGRKLLRRPALMGQSVASSDSVLGAYRGRRGGLGYRYASMVRKAFKPEFWGAPGYVDASGFTHMEANFSLYWGLAIQMYEATLVPNMTRYDQFARGNDAALTEQEKLGLEVFIRDDRGACMACHTGSAFTSASVAMRALPPANVPEIDPLTGLPFPPEPMERMRTADGTIAVYDGGFYNIGVTLTGMDNCVGGEIGGFPISYSRQASTGNIVDAEAGVDAVIGGELDFAVTAGPVALGESVDVDGACKTPTLRNVELTAPYFHNGGHLTLEQTVLSYQARFEHLFANENAANLSPVIPKVDIEGLAIDGVSTRVGEVDALVAFMKTLTDERVRLHQAPFDHPSLKVPNGSTGVDSNGDGKADDIVKILPAVGAGGYPAPLPDFLE